MCQVGSGVRTAREYAIFLHRFIGAYRVNTSQQHSISVRPSHLCSVVLDMYPSVCINIATTRESEKFPDDLTSGNDCYPAFAAYMSASVGHSTHICSAAE